MSPEQAIRLPLVMATLMFAGGTVLMWRLERDRRGREAAARLLPVPEPAEVTAGTES
jgi:hypothetical protein